MYQALSILMGYLFGCINMSYIFGRIRGFDIRERGSNNAGASNAVVTMGFKTGVIVALWDILKAFVPSVLAGILFPQIKYAPLLAGAAAVLGHIFPFWMKFKGGKGLASFLGLILAQDWRMFLIFGVIVVLITLITDYIAIGTLVTTLGYSIYAIILYSTAIITGVMLLLAAVMVCKHIINLKRIFAGEEIGLSQTLGKKKR